MARRPGQVTAESRDLYELTNRLKGADKKWATEFKREIAKVAEPIRRRVAAEASWSRRIPGATKASTRFTKKTNTVIITVNRRLAPHARPLENDGKEGTFEHPVFVSKTRRGRAAQVLGRKRTVRQQARPFFAKAIKSQDHRIDAAVEAVAADFERRLGFRR